MKRRLSGSKRNQNSLPPTRPPRALTKKNTASSPAVIAPASKPAFSPAFYPKGTRVEVAVPFTPGAGAIFVPIRIVFSEPIRSAGLFRHGAAYLKPPE